MNAYRVGVTIALRHRYVDLGASRRRQAASQIRDSLKAGQRQAALCATYADLACMSLLTYGTMDPYWLYCYELCDRLIHVQMYARRRNAS